MALGNPSLAVAVPSGATTSSTTASFTPSAGEYLVAIAWLRQQTTPPASASISDSLGLSWSSGVALQGFDGGANPRFGVRVWTAEATG